MSDPITREETFLAAAAGDSVTLPKPITRVEQYLKRIAERTGTGGGSPDSPQNAALTFTGAVSATYDGSVPVSVNIPAGGSGGGDEWELVTEITPTETATVIYETFANGYKKLHIEFDDMRSTLENPTNASQVWFNLNGTVHNDRKAFRLAPNGNFNQGTVFGTNYSSYGVIDIEYTKDFIHCKYICFWGADNIADYGALLKISDVGSAINSLRLHIGGNHEFAATLKMKIWGVRA